MYKREQTPPSPRMNIGLDIGVHGCRPLVRSSTARTSMRASFFEARGSTMRTQFASKTQMSEESLIRAGQQGDPQALNTLFHRHQRTLFHSALGIMGNPQDAEDALQDGLLSAFRNLKSFEGRSQFSTWLTRVVTNAALM